MMNDEADGSAADHMTPECDLCGQENVGVGVDTILILKGMWFPSIEYDVPLFLLDPDTRLRIIEMPNRQLALLPDTLGYPTKHAHTECLEQLVDGYEEEEGEDEDEEPGY
jgi:hypothetical protein